MLVLGSLRGTAPQNKMESRGHQTLADTHKDLGAQKKSKDSLGGYTVLVANLHYLKLSFKNKQKAKDVQIEHLSNKQDHVNGCVGTHCNLSTEERARGSIIQGQLQLGQ